MTSQPELNAHGSRKVRRLACAQGWLETNSCGDLLGLLVEPVSQRLHDAVDANRTIRQEDHRKGNITLNSQTACLFRIGWSRFGQDFDRLEFHRGRHLSIAKSWVTLRARFPHARLLGFSATPCRLDRAGFDDMYAELVLGPSTRELIERGYLTPYRAFVTDPPDLSGIKKNAEGDYRETDLAWS